ncbi:cation diffusion facilitator family transporter [Antricoccus suffuscus]|uniref:Cation diffusion facilitator family transporter n=1 Tax=Antricoccus suffuscus TaxID=1629062 RepID=A0A2T0ZVZ9_9ACTN|nr:cation diffusion facilitator family transporter [Antricoccus suffuscus]PRZ40536.1 cation diffusion facilitator family transporter [Antricoccus suffuscus]
MAVDQVEQKSGISLTVVIAFAANLLIAVGKSIAAVVTGSASMTAEAAHSWADAGNEIFLFVAERRGSKPRDERHPMGYGRETYVWSMFAAFGLFTVGAVLSIQHGIESLTADPGPENYPVAYIVLAAAALLEGTSFAQAFREARRGALGADRGTLEHVLESSNPTLRAVFAEDAAALVGLAIAFLGIFLHQMTGIAAYDAVGSILIGVLLGVVAVILIDRNRRFLIGETSGKRSEQAAVRFLLERAEIDRVTYVHLEFVGPSRVYLVAAVDIRGNNDEEHVSTDLRRVERELETHEFIEEAVLTLATKDEKSLPIG